MKISVIENDTVTSVFIKIKNTSLLLVTAV